MTLDMRGHVFTATSGREGSTASCTCGKTYDWERRVDQHHMHIVFTVKAQALDEAAQLMEDIARSETTTRRFTEHVLVEAGAPNVLREYAQRYRNLA